MTGAGSDTVFVSVNEAASPLVAALLADAASLRLDVERRTNGSTVIDAGVAATGGLDAGQRIAEISLAGLGSVSLVPAWTFEHWPWQVVTRTRQPVLACIASQMAGWRINDASARFEAIGSGPARALIAQETEFQTLDYQDAARSGCLVLETDALPPDNVIEEIAQDCGISASQLTLIVSPTQSLSGVVQIAARVLSTALLKMQAEGLPVDCVVDAIGSAPLPPPGGSAEEAMGRTNDALLYGGQVQLFVRGNDALAKAIADKVPSCTAPGHGMPFGELVKEAGGFYKLDPAVFAPAKVIVTALETGHSHHGGRFDTPLLQRSFGFD